MKYTKDPAKVVRDPDAIAIDRTTRILNELDGGGRDRVLDFLCAKYGPECARAKPEGAVAGGVS